MFESPDDIARSRQVRAHTVLHGRFDVARYPFRNLAVTAVGGVWTEQLGLLLAAAEVLTQAGFELVGVTAMERAHAATAILKR